jgi:hypothetical protein
VGIAHPSVLPGYYTSATSIPGVLSTIAGIPVTPANHLERGTQQCFHAPQALIAATRFYADVNFPLFQ